jgi:hypothetical protein
MLPRCPVPRAWKNFVVAPLTWLNLRLSPLPCPPDQDFCSFWSTRVTPSSSNLFYIVDIHRVNFTRRVLL